MPNPRTSLFPATHKDVSKLRQSATDAVNDFSSSATTHASKVGGQIKDLAGHIQEEGGQHLDRVKGRLTDIANIAYDFATDRPLVCIGAALALGFLIGASRRRRPEPSHD